MIDVLATPLEELRQYDQDVLLDVIHDLREAIRLSRKTQAALTRDHNRLRTECEKYKAAFGSLPGEWTPPPPPDPPMDTNIHES